MESSRSPKDPDYILSISSYPPRECGIATFTQDLVSEFNKRFNLTVKGKVCALNEQSTNIYNYNSNVINQITANELEDYVFLAKKINANKKIKLVNIQHEFGIFGGKFGNYIVPFLQALEKPAITTFHSVIPKPNSYLKRLIKIIAKNSQCLVVMNKLSQDVLIKNYSIPCYKISYIPHGIPQVSYEQNKTYKKELGLEGKIVASTFGLMSKNKGIQYAIKALPKVVKKFPNFLYLIIGETHPCVRKKDGESYRNSLNKRIKKLGLKDHVKFYNKYVSLEEIIKFLKASDVYISSCLDQNQSVSGTISYALGCGKPVISTPTEYAKHIINKENGILVKFRNSNDITKALLSIISDEKKMKAMGISAYKNTRQMIWPNVVEEYFKLYKKFTKINIKEDKLPPIKFDHIIKLTDDFGIIQHARYNRPEKRFGYSLDDVARALIACSMYYKNHPDEKIKNLMKIYLDFFKFVQRKKGTFSNIISSKKQKDKTTEEDVQGRAIWALGYILAQEYLPKEITRDALNYFNKSLSILDEIKAPRAMAFAMNGIYFYLKCFPEKKEIKNEFKKMADKLVQMYEKNKCPDWQWFEDFFTYSNSKLPEALFFAYDILKNKKYLDIAQSSLEFLDSITFKPGYYTAIGQNGWYFKNKNRSYFDQQPEDAASMVQAKITAYKITKREKYIKDALTAFRWFLGKNYLNLMIYDESTGGCHDGLGQHGLNLNQGAESTISYAMARLCFEEKEIINAIKKL